MPNLLGNWRNREVRREAELEAERERYEFQVRVVCVCAGFLAGAIITIIVLCR